MGRKYTSRSSTLPWLFLLSPSLSRLNHQRPTPQGLTSDDTDTTSIQSDIHNTFHHFAEQQSTRAIEDNTDNEPMFQPTQLTRSTQLPIMDLLDFNEASWPKVIKEAV